MEEVWLDCVSKVFDLFVLKLLPFMSAWYLDIFAVLAPTHLRLGAFGGLLSYENTLTAEPTGQLDGDAFESLVFSVLRRPLPTHGVDPATYN